MVENSVEMNSKNFVKKCGIERYKTTPYSPQQNGVVERINMTLMEK
jgi:hypothetical protein